MVSSTLISAAAAKPTLTGSGVKSCGFGRAKKPVDKPSMPLVAHSAGFQHSVVYKENVESNSPTEWMSESECDTDREEMSSAQVSPQLLAHAVSRSPSFQTHPCGRTLSSHSDARRASFLGPQKPGQSLLDAEFMNGEGCFVDVDSPPRKPVAAIPVQPIIAPNLGDDSSFNQVAFGSTHSLPTPQLVHSGSFSGPIPFEASYSEPMAHMRGFQESPYAVHAAGQNFVHPGQVTPLMLGTPASGANVQMDQYGPPQLVLSESGGLAQEVPPHMLPQMQPYQVPSQPIYATPQPSQLPPALQQNGSQSFAPPPQQWVVAQPPSGSLSGPIMMTPEAYGVPQTAPYMVQQLSPGQSSASATPCFGAVRMGTPPQHHVVEPALWAPHMVPAAASYPPSTRSPSPQPAMTRAAGEPDHILARQLGTAYKGLYGPVTCHDLVNISDPHCERIEGCLVRFFNEERQLVEVNYDPRSIDKKDDEEDKFVIRLRKIHTTTEFFIAFESDADRKPCLRTLERVYNLTTHDVIGKVTMGFRPEFRAIEPSMAFHPRFAAKPYERNMKFELVLRGINPNLKIKDVKRTFNQIAPVKHVQMPMDKQSDEWNDFQMWKRAGGTKNGVVPKRVPNTTVVFLTMKNLEDAKRVLTVCHDPAFACEFGGIDVMWSYHSGANRPVPGPDRRNKPHRRVQNCPNRGGYQAAPRRSGHPSGFGRSFSN